MNKYFRSMHLYGWFKIHRKLLDHWIWCSEKPFAQGQAWLDLIGFAAFKEEEVVVNKQVVKLLVGQQIRSQALLAERWGWTRGKVRSFLQLLKTHAMIQTDLIGKNLIITICNYDDYQNEDLKNIENIFESNQMTTNIKPDEQTNNNPCTAMSTATDLRSKEVKKKRRKENNFLKRDMQLDESLRKNSERKARAAQKIICKFFFDHLDENKLQRVWNELGLIQVAEISPPAKQQAYLRYREFIERYHGDDVFSPLVDNLEYDEELDSYQSYFTESQLLTILPTPTFWVCSYLVNSFQDYITEYHRGKNPNQWVADIDFAFNRETYRKVTDKDGEDFHYQINEVPFIRGLKVNQ